MFNFFKKKQKPKFTLEVSSKVIPSPDDDFTTYIEFPDGLRLIVQHGKYIGHYVA